MNSKNIILAITIFSSVIVVLVSGCIHDDTNSSNSTATKAYEGYNVTFEYPGTWSEYNSTTGNDNIANGSVNVKGKEMTFYTNRGLNNDLIFAEKNYVTLFSIQIIPTSDLSPQQVTDLISKSEIPAKWKKISNSTLTIDGNSAYMETFRSNELIISTKGIYNGMRYEVIYFTKNGKTYYILLQDLDQEFDKEKSNFDLILNSLKIN